MRENRGKENEEESKKTSKLRNTMIHTPKQKARPPAVNLCRIYASGSEADMVN